MPFVDYGGYASRGMLYLSYATDCRMLLTLVLRSSLRSATLVGCISDRPVASGVIDSAHQWSAVSLTPPPLVSGVIVTTDHKKSNLKVEFLGKLESKKKKIFCMRLAESYRRQELNTASCYSAVCGKNSSK
jgi:hypothetical protein